MNKTYCILPFIHIATERNGDYMPCCASKETTGHNLEDDSINTVWNSEYYQKLRSDLLAGVQHSNCNECWEYEKLGFISKRQISNSYNTEMLLKPLDMPVELDIKTGNLCNLKCITCNQLASSLHEKEIKEWKFNKIQLPTWLKTIEDSNVVLDLKNINNVNDNLDQALKSAKFLTLQGGEPFLTPMTANILDYCIEKNYTQISVSVITNLSTVTPKILNRIKKFPNADIAVSYDHIDSNKFEFIRYPANYEHFSKNLKTIIADESFKFGISFTISIFNVLELEKIFDKFIELSMLKNFKFLNMQPVVEPSYFSILYLEDFQKVKIIDAINKILNKKTTLTETKNVKNNLIELRKMLDIPVDNFYQTVKERTTVLKTYDQLRGTNYKKLFPYIKDYE